MTSSTFPSSFPKRKMIHLMHQDAMGGGPIVMNQMIRDFSKEFEVTAIVGGCGKVTAACKNAGIPVHSIAIDRLWKCVLGFFQLLFLLGKIKPDVLFLHGQWGGPLGALAGRLAKISSIIYVAHSPAFYHRQTLKNSIRSYISENIPSKLSDAVVVLSVGNQYQYLIRHLVPEEKLHLIHNGLDFPSAFLPFDGTKIKTQFRWEASKRHFVFLGRLDRQKSVSWLLEAWEIVIRGRTSLKLWVVGSGPMEKELKMQARRLKLGITCEFLPDQPDGREFVAAADVVVLPSLYEGHALVPLETMAAGKVFVGTSADGIVDSIKDGREGLLVEPGNIGALAVALQRTIDDPLLCGELGKNARERVKEFDWELSFLKYDKLVHNLLERKAS